MTRDWRDAALRGDAAALQSLLQAGTAINSLDRYNQTALMLAARHAHAEVVELLIRAGADLEVTAKYGLSALMLAVINQHDKVARLLGRSGGQPRHFGLQCAWLRGEDRG